jgi:hypothetical protein
MPKQEKLSQLHSTKKPCAGSCSRTRQSSSAVASDGREARFASVGLSRRSRDRGAGRDDG